MMMMMMMIVYRVEGEGQEAKARGGRGGIRRRAYEKRESQPPYTPPYTASPLRTRDSPRYARTIRRNLQLAPFVGKL
jgi:hypothetical protein